MIETIQKFAPLLWENTLVTLGMVGASTLITSIPTAPAIADAYYRYDGKRRTSLPLEGTPYSKK